MYNDIFIVLDMLMILKKMFMAFDWISLGSFLAVWTLQRATTTLTRDIVVISKETHDTVAERLQLEVELSLHVHYRCKQLAKCTILSHACQKKYKKNFIWNYIILLVLTNANKAWSEYDIY